MMGILLHQSLLVLVLVLGLLLQQEDVLTHLLALQLGL